MLRVTGSQHVQYRAYDNLPSNAPYGRMMTGYITPYRHWMWKQNELWRNVHEAQFEYLRRLYKRQWYESYRVNADEYIHKYNITKAAQLTTWENEMHAQDARRRDSLNNVQALGKLSDKRRDLFREIHERDFFHWYERASERLQAMKKIPFIPRDSINDHIDKELKKYVVGREGPYPLNFVGQMPVLEDSDLNVAQVPSHYMANYTAERPTTATTEYTPPTPVSASDQLVGVVSSEAHELFASEGATSEQLNTVLDDMAREGESGEGIMEEKSEDETERDRRAYIDRGKTGSKHRVDWKQSTRAQVITPESTSALGEKDGQKKRATKKAPPKTGVAGSRSSRQQIIEDAMSRQRQKGHDAAESDGYLHGHLEKSSTPLPGIGEAAGSVPKIRQRLKMPGMDDVLRHPAMASQAGGVRSTTSIAKDKDKPQDPSK